MPTIVETPRRGVSTLIIIEPATQAMKIIGQTPQRGVSTLIALLPNEAQGRRWDVQPGYNTSSGRHVGPTLVNI